MLLWDGSPARPRGGTGNDLARWPPDCDTIILLSRFSHLVLTLACKMVNCCNVCATQSAGRKGHTIYSVILLDPAPNSPLQLVEFVPALSSLGRS